MPDLYLNGGYGTAKAYSQALGQPVPQRFEERDKLGRFIHDSPCKRITSQKLELMSQDPLELAIAYQRASELCLTDGNLEKATDFTTRAIRNYTEATGCSPEVIRQRTPLEVYTSPMILKQVGADIARHDKEFIYSMAGTLQSDEATVQQYQDNPELLQAKVKVEETERSNRDKKIALDFVKGIGYFITTGKTPKGWRSI